MYILNKSGPKIEPRGIPVLMGDHKLSEFVSFDLCYLPER